MMAKLRSFASGDLVKWPLILELTSGYLGSNGWAWLMVVDGDYEYVIDNPKRSDKLKARELVDAGSATGYQVSRRGDSTETLTVWFAHERVAFRYIIGW